MSVTLWIGTPNIQAQREESRQRLYDKYKIPDAATKAARSKASELVAVRIKSLEEREKAVRQGTVVEDYGSFVVLAKNKGAKFTDSSLEKQKLDTRVSVPRGSFDPVADESSMSAASRISEAEAGSAVKDFYLVQLASIAKEEWLKSFDEIGAEVVQYVPHQAFVVYADGASLSKLRNHSRVRWVGKVSAEQKISPFLEEFIQKERRVRQTAIFDVAVYKRSELLYARNSIISATRAKVLDVAEIPNNFFDIIRVELPLDDVAAVAALKDVVRIDPYIKPEKEDERAAQIVAGNYLSPTSLLPPGYNPLAQFGVDGTGVTVSVVDDGVSIPGNGGFYVTTQNAVDGPLRGATAGAEGGHGHINASIIAGNAPFGVLDPLGYNYGMGIAPNAHIVNIPFLKTNNTTTDAQAVDDALKTLGPNGVKATISNNSWGAGTNNNSYGSFEALYDGLVQDGSIGGGIDPFTIIFSAGNCGNAPSSSACSSQNGLTRPKMAKNVIVVGNSLNLRNELISSYNNMDDLANSSSRGPAADGRIKPDITAPGSGISGSRGGSGMSVSGQIDANHSWSTGTSHAAPQVAGAAALFAQYWKNRNAGAHPSPAMIKAAIINTAQDMNGLNTSAAIPNGNEGWGRINLKFMLNTGVPMKYIDQTFEFSDPGTTVLYNGFVGDSSKPFRISLVWTDPPGVSDPSLVNNLDLTVTVGGVEYKGNVFSGGKSVVGGTSDTVNNVENVFLPAGIAAGTPVTVRVTATAVNGNGILGNADNTDQNFALVAYNFTEQAPIKSRSSDFDGDGKADISVFRPSNGAWYALRSSDSSFMAIQFGQNGDMIAPGDFDGDGKTDQAVFRPSNGVWYIMQSRSGFTAAQFGQNGDLPVAGDFDGDGKTDIAVYRPSTGVWYLLQSTGGFAAAQFGINGDKPVPADYDGDGKTDIAVYRPSNGVWYMLQSAGGFKAVQFGISSDKVAVGDFDGDGKADQAVFREASGEWFLLRSQLGFIAYQFGQNGDIPSAADFNGDGKHDITVFRPSNGVWYLTSSVNATQFGTNGDAPVASAYVPIQ